MSEYLSPTWVVGSIDLTYEPFMVDRENAVDIGEPEMAVESIVSQLADGDLERPVRYGNRTYVIPIYVTGPTLADVADNEALLRAELRRPGLTLTHNPGDSWAVDSVYEVQTARMTPARDDTHEAHLIRRWTLTLTCAPFARASSAVTVQALAPPPVSPTTVSITTADTTTGWSATRYSLGASPVTPVDMGAYVQFATDASAPGESVYMDVLLSIAATSLASTPYVVLEMSGNVGSAAWFTVGGVRNYFPPVFVRATTSGTTLYGFAVGSGSLTAIDFQSSTPSFTGPLAINIHDVYRTDTLPVVTSHQGARSLAVTGTERSPASISIAPGTSGSSIGWTIVHTTPETLAGYSPALRQYRLSGNTVTASSTLMSGGREPVNSTPVVAQVPLASLPEGEYALAALMRSTVVGTFPIFYEARTLLPGIGYLGGTSDTVSATFTAANTWTLIPLDVVTLPPVRSNGAFVQLNLSRTPVAAEVIDLDEWWTLRMGDDCATTILYDNAGFLWLDSPDVSSGVPRIWVGGNSNRTDAHHPSFNLYAQGAHALHPDGTAIFVATSGLEYPNVSATYYPRYHSNAAS